MRLFFDPNIIPEATRHSLNLEESKHILKVLRLKQGETIGILDGKGGFYECEIVEGGGKQCEIEVISSEIIDLPKPQIHIAIAPTKQMERLEWFVEKATEIGVTEISLITCKNSERTIVKKDRLLRKAISAMKQSQRRFLPSINESVKLADFVAKNPNGLIAHCNDSNGNEIRNVFKLQNCPILIGPEGDFTSEEIQFSINNGYKSINLGSYRLRTETAALYACMQANMVIEHV